MSKAITDQLKWKGNELFYGKKRMSAIQQDDRYPNMWRVVEADGSLSDMVNLSRARDAAMARADRLVRDLPRASG